MEQWLPASSMIPDACHQSLCWLMILRPVFLHILHLHAFKRMDSDVRTHTPTPAATNLISQRVFLVSWPFSMKSLVSSSTITIGFDHAVVSKDCSGGRVVYWCFRSTIEHSLISQRSYSWFCGTKWDKFSCLNSITPAIIILIFSNWPKNNNISDVLHDLPCWWSQEIGDS
jgi:hypothetical protein